MTATDPPRVFAIIPAAGASVRMGQPKQLLAFGESTMLETVIETVLEGDTDGVIVVTNPMIEEALDLTEDPRHLTAILHDDRAEMLDSILLGVDGLKQRCAPVESDAFMVCPGDVPRVTSELVRACADSYRTQPDAIVVATHGGKPGHPIVTPFAMLEEVKSLRQTGLRGILESKSDHVRHLEVEAPETQQDIDTPEDYQRLSDSTKR